MEKILILQFKRIGDLILTTPAIRCLREAFPGAKITLATGADCAGLADCIPVDQVWLHHRGQLASNAWIANGLAFSGPDVCLDFDGTDRSGLLAVLSGAKRKVTFERFRRKFPRSFLYSNFAKSSVVERHTADHYTDLLRPLGIERENVPLDIRIPAAAAEEARHVLDAEGITGAYAIIHAGTARPEKYWQPEKWAEVAEYLHESNGLACVLTGSKDAEEQKHLAAIKAASTVPLHDLSGKTSLPALAAVIRGARLFCGVDTAAMHFADAVLTPTVALFGPTNPFQWHPRHTASVALRANTAPPFTTAQKGGPMERISSVEVIEAIRGLIR